MRYPTKSAGDGARALVQPGVDSIDRADRLHRLVMLALGFGAATALSIAALLTALDDAAAHDVAVFQPLRAVRPASPAGAPDGLAAYVWRVHDAPTDWSYPFACCSGFDCRPVAAGAIGEGAGGYTIRATGEVIAFGDTRLKHSPDSDFHWCSVAGSDDGRTICLFVPPRSF